MNIDLINTLRRRPAENGRADSELEEKLRSFLQAMLVGIRRHRETPLLAGFDSRGIVDSALQNCSTSDPQVILGHLQDSETVNAVFNLLVKRALIDDLDRPEASICLARGEQSNAAPAIARQRPNEKAPHPLTVWLEQFYAVMSEVHPRALEIVALRVESYTNREIAQRLESTPRLVRRIVHDMQQAWQSAVEKE